ncbi:hypothetical protein GCM10023208_04710 [Erythrobacter westpacificensis]|uniref:Glutamine amidotransferase domain-containing protein n=1 Tax=Erythrobacter westpacificensis TaxID=1055231 RepID=A0ABP9K2R0_9SPHN
MRLLLLEGNTRAARAASALAGVAAPGEIYARALRAEVPGAYIRMVYGADTDCPVPDDNEITECDGLVISGSALHAYDLAEPVTRQIEFVQQVARLGLPIFGSCWGLQIAVMAAGGMVARNEHRAEMGIARKIWQVEAGQDHPLLAGRAPCFDAPCIHYDDVTQMPANSTVLAANSHCPVQAAEIRLEKSVIWAVQYHPEFDLPHTADLFEFYAEGMVRNGYFHDASSLASYAADLRQAASFGSQSPAAFRLGVDEDVIDGHIRRTEIRNWLEMIPASA